MHRLSTLDDADNSMVVDQFAFSFPNDSTIPQPAPEKARSGYEINQEMHINDRPLRNIMAATDDYSIDTDGSDKENLINYPQRDDEICNKVKMDHIHTKLKANQRSNHIIFNPNQSPMPTNETKKRDIRYTSVWVDNFEQNPKMK